MSLLDWLALPLSGASEHHLPAWAAWHARSMVLAWAVLLPLGALLARYFKVMPGQRWPDVLDNPRWWHGHRALQWAGVLLMTLGLVLIWDHGSAATALAQWHRLAGWLVLALGWFQIASGLLRGSKGGPTAPAWRGDHYDMSPQRRWFERLHKSLGWLAVLLAWGTTLLGLKLVDAPRWMPLLLGLWWLGLVLLAWQLQRRGRSIDTYQAIWGPDPSHPGNRMKPIGWGVNRPKTRLRP